MQCGGIHDGKCSDAAEGKGKGLLAPLGCDIITIKVKQTQWPAMVVGRRSCGKYRLYSIKRGVPMQRSAVFAIVVGLAVRTWAATWHVAPSGNDGNDGTSWALARMALT